MGDLIMDVLNPIAAGVDILGSLFNTGADIWKAGYQKELQEKTWLREDTAVQRRVADLKAAGLSPVLAAGSAAQIMAPIDITRPQVQLDAQQKVALAMDMMRQKQDIARSAAETVLTEKMQRNADLDALNKNAEYKIKSVEAEQRAVQLQSDKRDLQLNIKDGLRSNDTGLARDLMSIGRAITQSFQNGSTAGSLLDAILGHKPGDKAVETPFLDKTGTIKIPGYEMTTPGTFRAIGPKPSTGWDRRNR